MSYIVAGKGRHLVNTQRNTAGLFLLCTCDQIAADYDTKTSSPCSTLRSKSIILPGVGEHFTMYVRRWSTVIFLVFVQSHISGCIYPNFNKFSLDIASGCDMIILWLCNILGISGFVLYLPQPGKSKTSRMSTQSDSLGASKDFTL